jgi:sterol desaturase/sphingolipid hydroxylase (fatty acid hydroxylase superfamily)
MHRIHHRRGHHANNYGIPIWDLMFGTYENTEEYVKEVGFSDEKTIRIYEMLVGIDVHKK